MSEENLSLRTLYRAGDLIVSSRYIYVIVYTEIAETPTCSAMGFYWWSDSESPKWDTSHWVEALLLPDLVVR